MYLSRVHQVETPVMRNIGLSDSVHGESLLTIAPLTKAWREPIKSVQCRVTPSLWCYLRAVLVGHLGQRQSALYPELLVFSQERSIVTFPRLFWCSVSQLKAAADEAGFIFLLGSNEVSRRTRRDPINEALTLEIPSRHSLLLRGGAWTRQAAICSFSASLSDRGWRRWAVIPGDSQFLREARSLLSEYAQPSSRWMLVIGFATRLAMVQITEKGRECLSLQPSQHLLPDPFSCGTIRRSRLPPEHGTVHFTMIEYPLEITFIHPTSTRDSYVGIHLQFIIISSRRFHAQERSPLPNTLQSRRGAAGILQCPIPSGEMLLNNLAFGGWRRRGAQGPLQPRQILPPQMHSGTRPDVLGCVWDAGAGEGAIGDV
ncbi:hypothetical protein FB451DRAFT_1377218 [Mycena latifolia]|nr:hypothetical protein FB451DRAFT_1377218 [Mycena latifolia]